MERSRQRNCQKEGKITFFRGGLERPLNKVKEDESIHLIWPMCAHTHVHSHWGGEKGAEVISTVSFRKIKLYQQHQWL